MRKEPDIITRQRMIAEIFTSGMYKRLITNIAQREGGLPGVTVVFPLYGNGATKRGRTIALRVAPLICASVRFCRFGLFAPALPLMLEVNDQRALADAFA